MPNLSEATIAKMRKVIKAVLAEPEYYDQQYFPKASDCGQTCCAAGWAVWLFEPAREYRKLAKRTDEVAWRNKAEEALGLPPTGWKLFGHARDWPLAYSVMYLNARNPRGRAEAMAARWERYIATDGAE